MKTSKLSRLSAWLVIPMLFLLTACSSPEEKARAHYESGKQLLESGDYVRAGLEFRNAVKFNDKLAEAWFDLAIVEEQAENWGGALQALTRVTELDPKNVDARVKLARYQLAAIQLDAALKNANAANELKPNDDGILALRSAILFRLDDKEAAIADAERALAINKENPDPYAVLAADAMAAGNRVSALQFVDRGLTSDPNNLGLLLFKMKLLDETKDDKGLEAVLRQIVASHPKLPQMRQALLFFLVSRNRLPEVETEMRAMLVADPQNEGLALDLVRFLSDTKGKPAARAELASLIAANPAVTAYRLTLAQLDFSEQKVEDAVKGLEAIITANEKPEDVLKAKLQLAAMRMDLRETDKTRVIVDEILTTDEKNADGLFLRARLKLDASDTDGAIADIREALNQRPQSVPFLVLLARAQEQKGNVDLAIEHFGEAVKLSNYTPQLALEFTGFLELRGRRNQAETILTEAASRNPKSRDILTALGRAKLAQQDWAGAQKIAEAIKKLDDSSPVADQMLAAVLAGQKKYDDSIAVLKNVQADAPEGSGAMRNLVLVYIQAGKFAEADSFLNSVLEANPKNTEARVLLGYLRAAEKKPAEAEAAFRKAIAEAPDNPMGYSALAKTLMGEQKFDEAEKLLDEAQAKAGPDLNVALDLGFLRERRGDIEGALAVYEAQLKLTPEAPIVLNNIASLLSDHREDAESLTRADQLASRLAGIDFPHFKDTMGWIAYRRGDYKRAQDLLLEAVEKLPDNPLARFHLGMTYLALKQPAEAKAQLTKAAELKPDENLAKKISAGLQAAEVP